MQFDLKFCKVCVKKNIGSHILAKILAVFQRKASNGTTPVIDYLQASYMDPPLGHKPKAKWNITFSTCTGPFFKVNNTYYNIYISIYIYRFRLRPTLKFSTIPMLGKSLCLDSIPHGLRNCCAAANRPWQFLRSSDRKIGSWCWRRTETRRSSNRNVMEVSWTMMIIQWKYHGKMFWHIIESNGM